MPGEKDGLHRQKSGSKEEEEEGGGGGGYFCHIPPPPLSLPVTNPPGLPLLPPLPLRCTRIVHIDRSRIRHAVFQVKARGTATLNTSVKMVLLDPLSIK